MSLLKSIERLKRIDYFLKKESTGPSEEFAEKIGISRSMLMENLREMRDLGAKLDYCPSRRSYVYMNDFTLIIGCSMKNTLKGGTNQLFLVFNKIFFAESSGAGHPRDNLALRIC